MRQAAQAVDRQLDVAHHVGGAACGIHQIRLTARRTHALERARQTLHDAPQGLSAVRAAGAQAARKPDQAHGDFARVVAQAVNHGRLEMLRFAATVARLDVGGVQEIDVAGDGAAHFGIRGGFGDGLEARQLIDLHGERQQQIRRIAHAFAHRGVEAARQGGAGDPMHDRLRLVTHAPHHHAHGASHALAHGALVVTRAGRFEIDQVQQRLEPALLAQRQRGR